VVIDQQDADNMARWEAELDSPDVDSPDSGDDDSDWWFDDGSGHPCLPGECDGDGMCGES
jgi:hypothetical protein